jgi:hypothetical protein
MIRVIAQKKSRTANHTRPIADSQSRRTDRAQWISLKSSAFQR